MVAAVPSEPGGRSTTTRKPQRTPGPVEKAARTVLADIDTDHAAADLLGAMAETFAQDVDDRGIPVRDRVAASKELREILRELDTAVIPPRVPGPPPEGGHGAAAADDDDPFAIGSVPPVLGDAEAS